MKLTRSLALIAVLFIVFITAQSFYRQVLVKFSNKQQTKKDYLYRHVAYCGPAFIEPDSVQDIPALKGWGNYHFKITTTSDSAQYYFDQGLSMYYAFHTIEAYASFSKANKLDTNCAMAWYGKALAMGPTINYPNNFKAPDAALEAARRSKVWARNCTPLELALIDAMQQRYSADTTISVTQLRRNYADAMQKAFSKYPKDADVLTLYADALMLLHPWDLYDHDFKPKAWTPQIRTLLEAALAISPKHPGANHYYIHTLEASGEPGMALKSAAVLDTMMPSVSHITHMPSHIYIRTGHYQQGIIDNDAAVAGYHAYLKRYAPVEGSVGLYVWHNIHLKVNCAQMGGDYKDAMASSKAVKALMPASYLGLKTADGNYLQYMYMQPLITAVRFGKWDDVLKVTTPDTLRYATALTQFGRGLAYCGKGQIKEAKKELLKLEMSMKDSVLKSPMDNANTAYEAIVVGHSILKGMIAAGNRQYIIAITELEKAVLLEDGMRYGEPRDWPLPARHYLGAVLLKAGNYNKAIAVLNRDLFINPNNGWALTGLQTAYRQTRNAAQMNKIHAQLISASKIKDVTIAAPVY
jgi:tetratricopeptide (TPR) repeat protein